MPEYVLDSRGRRRSVLLSVKECGSLAQKLDGLREKLDITTFPADDEERAVAAIEQRVRAAGAARTLVLAGSHSSSAAVAERAKVCGARVVTHKGKTVACVLSWREWNLLVDHLEWLDDSAYMQDALARGRGEFVEMEEFFEGLRRGRQA